MFKQYIGSFGACCCACMCLLEWNVELHKFFQLSKPQLSPRLLLRAYEFFLFSFFYLLCLGRLLFGLIKRRCSHLHPLQALSLFNHIIFLLWSFQIPFFKSCQAWFLFSCLVSNLFNTFICRRYRSDKLCSLSGNYNIYMIIFWSIDLCLGKCCVLQS